MFGKKKKVSAVADKNELAELDNSVSELSKQTSELLKGFKDKSSASESEPIKPSTVTDAPKTRAAASRSHVKSFDIIQHPKTRTSLKSTLKSSPETNLVSDSEIELLPEHATKSFNEIEAVDAKSPIQDVSPATSTIFSTPSVIGHRAGSLQVSSEIDTVTDTSKITNEDKTETQELSESEEESNKTEAEQVETKNSDSPSVQGITFEEEQIEVEESADNPLHDEDKKQSDANPLSADTNEADKTEVTETTVNPQDSGELYANNLVHDAKPKSYSPLESQQKPTVFDTNEYHVELHDWSKLKHKNSVIWYFIVLIVVIAAAAAYMLLTDQKLPF